jgi:hypothetical protein
MQGEVVGGERRELHRVLQQARSGREAGARQVRRARVVLADRVEDRVVGAAGSIRDEEELVRRRESDVAPRVREELRELCLHRADTDGRRHQPGEERLGPIAGGRVIGPDDLGKRPKLLERVPLGDALRAERDVHRLAPLPERPRDAGGRTRVDGAAQHDERVGEDVVGQLVHDAVEDPHRRVEELVDGCADDDDHRIDLPEHERIVGQRKAAGGDDLGKELVRASLTKRHPAASDARQRVTVRVEHRDSESGRREGQAQWQTHVARAAEDDDVVRRGCRSGTMPDHRVTPTGRTRARTAR